MRKKLGNYAGGSLAGIVLGGAVFLSGCAKNVDYMHELFRHDDVKNIQRLREPIELDYSSYDEKNAYTVVNDRAYLKQEEKPKSYLEEIVDVPLPKKYRITSTNIEFIEDGNDLILQYRSRLPALDLSKLISPYLKDITINTYQNQNILVLNGPKKAFDYDDPEKKFTKLTNLLNEFDLPAVQVRVKMDIIEHFVDNTYDRDVVIEALKNNFNIFHLDLPSAPDPRKRITTGIDLNPFYNQNKERYSFKSAIKFLNSYGKARVLSEVDIWAANGSPGKFKNLTSIPYPEILEGKVGFIEAVKYRDTGTTLELTPYANDRGFITIKIAKAETGEQIGFYGPLQYPVFRTADFTTEITVRNGITYFGALSSFDRYKEVQRGIPIISVVPVLNELFSAKSIEKSESQLLYFIEARIIGREDDVGITENGEKAFLEYPDIARPESEKTEVNLLFK